MAVRVPQYLIGRSSTVSITPQTVSASGVWADHSIGTMSFYGLIESDGFESRLETQDFRPVNSFQANPVPVSYHGSYQITELMTALPTVTAGSQTGKIGGRGNILEAAISASWYHKVVMTVYQGALVAGQLPSAVRTYTFYALLTNLTRDTPKSRVVNRATFQLAAVGDGSGGFLPNPQIT